MHKLRALGTTGQLGRWILIFVSKRKQVVLVRERSSAEYILISRNTTRLSSGAFTFSFLHRTPSRRSGGPNIDNKKVFF